MSILRRNLLKAHFSYVRVSFVYIIVCGEVEDTPSNTWGALQCQGLDSGSPLVKHALHSFSHLSGSSLFSFFNPFKGNFYDAEDQSLGLTRANLVISC